MKTDSCRKEELAMGRRLGIFVSLTLIYAAAGTVRAQTLQITSPACNGQQGLIHDPWVVQPVCLPFPNNACISSPYVGPAELTPPLIFNPPVPPSPPSPIPTRIINLLQQPLSGTTLFQPIPVQQ